ncbi:hypothetical protein POM88_050146 [Heracleum sosnowskyi]|uniref:Uncharacterized protein n=1 Tax=Heracleum sosnowskyi TaxID=360622 RepID=A0AAD8GZJ6_9APIA|nr:hypothetical protein POM88_050146 [Heracleum sosnowskyi]
MEDKSTSNAIIVIQKDPKGQNINGGKKKKRFSLFRTAMVLLRNRPNEKPKAANIFNVPKCNDISESDGKYWKKVVGSMRPLHMQDSLSTPPQSPVPDKAFCVASTSSTSERSEDDIFSSSPSLSTTSWGTTTSASTTSLQDLAGSGTLIKKSESTHSLRKMSDNMSRYASALNLHDLGMDEDIEEDDEDDGDNVLENCEADNMIDSKADEFIARFYEQMRS